MIDPRVREDISRFVVHLTRRYGDQSPKENLIAILRDRTIEARNAHCLFIHDLRRLHFSEVLQNRFKTVCFTEAPLTQIKRLCAPILGRKIKLQPYGVIFQKADVLERGCSPAIYINAKGTQIGDFLRRQFRDHFHGIRKLTILKRDQGLYHEQIIQYYSLINIIASHHDFAWEREWRFNGDFKFQYIDIVAIIARDPDAFGQLVRDRITGPRARSLRKIPIISPQWSYEDIVETMSVQIWNSMS